MTMAICFFFTKLKLTRTPFIHWPVKDDVSYLCCETWKKFRSIKTKKKKKLRECWVHDISTLWPPHDNDDDDDGDSGSGGGTYPCASRCLLLFFLSSPTALVVRFAFAVRPIVTTVIVSRDAAAVSGGGRWDGGAKYRTGLLGRSWRPIDPAHTANGKRSAAETSQASRFSSVRKAAGSLSSLLFFIIIVFWTFLFDGQRSWRNHSVI